MPAIDPPGLELLLDGRRMRVPPGRPFVLGRGPGSDLDLPHPRVSRVHAVIEYAGTGWILTDRSSNGTYVDGRRVGVLPLHGSVVVWLGDSPDSATVEIRTGPGTGPATTPPVGRGDPTSVVRIGSAQRSAPAVRPVPAAAGAPAGRSPAGGATVS